MDLKKIVIQINKYEEILLNQNLPTVTFENIFTQICQLRKQILENLDYRNKIIESDRFLDYLEALLIQKERYMSNSTFDKVLMCLTDLHESFTKNARDVFIASENGTLVRLSLKMEQNRHSMTTHRLNQISKKQLELENQFGMDRE